MCAVKKKVTQTRDLRVGFLYVFVWLVCLGSWGFLNQIRRGLG